MLKRFALACVLMVAFAAPLYAQSTVSTPAPKEASHIHFAISAMMVAQFADISTTEYGLGKGLIVEGNPVLKWSTTHGPITTAVVKGSLATGVAMLLIHEHRSHPKVVTIAALAIGAATRAVAYHNARLISQLQK